MISRSRLRGTQPQRKGQQRQAVSTGCGRIRLAVLAIVAGLASCCRVDACHGTAFGAGTLGAVEGIKASAEASDIRHR
jgi:hypothetical protein